MKHADEFFAYAAERYRVKLRRDAGQPYPWTTDSVLTDFRFCNVFREDDKTTVWFRENVRELLRDYPDRALFATLAFRWFNRIEVGELIKDQLLGEWSSDEVRSRLRYTRPVVTGAYMIRTPAGMDKLDGVLWYIDNAIGANREDFNNVLQTTTLEQAWRALQPIAGMGPFLAYEVVSDMRYTCLLEQAPDIMTWANPGPGAVRGLTWVWGKKVMPTMQLDAMRDLLHRSLRSWPKEWPRWDMRTVEHTLCEFDKYKRGWNGQRLKRRYGTVGLV